MRVVVVQAGIGALTSLIFLLLMSRSAGMSAALATGCVLLPTMYYAWVQARTLNATRVLAHGAMKTVLTMVLIAVCIAVIGIEPFGFFVTFALMQLAYLFGKTEATASERPDPGTK